MNMHTLLKHMSDNCTSTSKNRKQTCKRQKKYTIDILLRPQSWAYNHPLQCRLSFQLSYFLCTYMHACMYN